MQPVSLLTLTDTDTRMYKHTHMQLITPPLLAPTHKHIECAHNTSVSVFVSPALSALVPLAYTLNGVYYG